MGTSNASVGRLKGVTADRTRTALEALRAPGSVPSLMRDLGLNRAESWGTIKHLHEMGYVDRTGRGTYQINAAGERALAPQRPPHKPVAVQAAPVPRGTGWTPERRRWLDRHYPRLGHVRCALLLGMTPQGVHAFASKRGLRFGEVDGYVLLTDLAELLVADYVTLYARAGRAHTLTFPGTVMHQERRSKAMVPDWWAEQIASEMQPPEPTDVAVEALRVELGLSKTQVVRVARPDSYLRTPVKGGQARLYVPQEAAGRLRARYSAKLRQPSPPEVGRVGILAALQDAGPEGASERELFSRLPCSRAAVRAHLYALWQAGELERWRLGDTLDPFVYRMLAFKEQPEPQRRRVVIPGRPRKARVAA